MARRIEVTIVGDSSDVERAFRRSGKAAGDFDRTLSRTSRGAIAASLSFKGLGRSVAFASGAFLGGAGIISVFKSTISAAEESQRVLAQTSNAVTRAGESWAKYGKTIDNVLLKQSQMSGFDDERLSGTFANLVRHTKDVNEALRLNALAANVARGRNIELEAAATLVTKASMGQAGALRRVGIDAQKGATGLQLINMLNQKFANSATAYANTAAGAQDRFRVALENFQEVLGAQALPTITKYLNRGADWLNNTKNQQKALEALKTAVGIVKDAVSAMTPFVKVAASFMEKFSDAVGGARHAIEILLGVLLAFKATRFLQQMGLVQGSLITTTGEANTLRFSLLRLAALPPVVIGISLLIENKDEIDAWFRAHHLDVLTHGLVRKGGILGGRGKTAPSKVPFSKDPGDTRPDTSGNVPSVHFNVAGGPDILSNPSAVTGTGGAATRSVAGTSGSGSARVPKAAPRGMATLSRATKNMLALAQARTPAEQLAALGEQRSILAEKIATVTRRLKNAKGPKSAKAFADQLAELNDEDKAALAQIASLHEDAARSAKSTSDKVKRSEERRQKAMMDTVQTAIGGMGVHLGVSGRLTVADVNKAIAANEASVKSNRAAVAAVLHKSAMNLRKFMANQEQASQFQELGLTASGEERAPSAGGLLARAANIQRAIQGTVLDTNKNRNILARIRKTIHDHLGELTRDTKIQMKQFLDALNPDSSEHAPQLRAKALNPASITKGLGLSREEARAIQFRIAGMHLTQPVVAGGGGGNVTIHVHSRSDDPKQVARETIKALQKEKSRRSTQVRGPHAGHPLGI